MVTSGTSSLTVVVVGAIDLVAEVSSVERLPVTVNSSTSSSPVSVGKSFGLVLVLLVAVSAGKSFGLDLLSSKVSLAVGVVKPGSASAEPDAAARSMMSLMVGMSPVPPLISLPPLTSSPALLLPPLVPLISPPSLPKLSPPLNLSPPKSTPRSPSKSPPKSLPPPMSSKATF